MKNPRVLLVEDDPELSKLYSRALQIEDIPFEHAPSGEEALEILKKKELPDIILLDISLPGIDGFEVLKRLKVIPLLAEIPVVIMSNFSRPEDIEWGKKLGAKKFIEKVSLLPADIVDIARTEARQL